MIRSSVSYEPIQMLKGMTKRKYEKRLQKALAGNKEFLIERLGQEWDQLQRSARREELVRKARAAGGVIAKSLLVLGMIGGVVMIATVAPNLFAAVGRIAGRSGFFERRGLSKATKYLRRRKYITLKKAEDWYELKITPKGADIILQKSLNELQVQHEGKWDGVWRMVIFDIPNKHKWARDALRRQLRAMGFYALQESVFVFPYECEQEIAFLIDLFSVSRYVRLVRTKDILHDDDLREFFGLENQ